MAKGDGDGNDGVETLVSSIRPGLKREFAMMMKSQGVLIELGKRRNGSRFNSSIKGSSKIVKRFKGSNGKMSVNQVVAEEEEQRSDVVDGAVVIEEPRDEEVNNVEANYAEVAVGETPVSRFTRSLLKPTGDEVENVEGNSDLCENGVEVGVAPLDGEGASSERPLRRFTCSLLKPTGGGVDNVEGNSNLCENGVEVGVAPLDGEGASSETPLRRFTCSFLKPTGGGVDNVEGNSNICENGVEVAAAPLDGEGDSSETLLRPFTCRSILKPIGEQVDSVEGNSDIREDAMEVAVVPPLNVEESSSGTLIRRFTRSLLKPTGDRVDNVEGNSDLCENAVEVGVVPLDGGGASSEMPLRRFTRSLLKPTGEASENSAREVVENEARTPMHRLSNMGMKTPTRLKELLETGLLEGLSVQYICGTKARAPGEGLLGLIQGSGILCFCIMCKGTKVVTPNQFELHAASANKRPPEYIYLENGRTLRDVLNACKGASSEILEQTIRQAVGCPDGKGPKQPVDSKGTSASVESVQCLNCKGCVLNGSHEEFPLCDACIAIAGIELSVNQSDDATRSLLKSTTEVSSSDSRSKVPGKLTKKDLGLHKNIFSSDYLPDGTALGYFVKGEKLLSGHKSGQGIYCDCCHKVVSPSTFEAHAGCASRRKPYDYIFTSNGASLHELSIKLKRQKKSSADENDDVCSICKQRGELLCCDSCPRAFHQECLGLQRIPQGEWYCRSCEDMIKKEKHAERNVNAIAAGRVAGADPFEEIKNRCIRILDPVQQGDISCVLCRKQKFSESGFDPFTVIICDQCEKEYHVGCLKEHEMDDLKELPEGKWFCRSECRSIHTALQNLVADGDRRIPDSMLDVIKKKHEENGLEDSFSPNITWRLIHGKTASEEDRKWLSDAVTVFHGRFGTIPFNAKQDDLIPVMIEGRTNGDHEFGGMYCAILAVNSTLVSAAIFRVFGQEAAEIPLVASADGCEGKGYFQSLFGCIEDLLASQGVKKLVLPAASKAKSIWMNKFRFKKMTAEQMKECKNDHHQLMIFQGTTALQKPVANSSCEEPS